MGIKFGKLLHQKWLAKKSLANSYSNIAPLIVININNYVYSLREGSRVAPQGVIPKDVSRSKLCCSFSHLVLLSSS